MLGIIFIIFIVLGICEKIINVILLELKFVVVVGIGLFIVFFGF